MHWNLALGTIASYREERPDLEPLIKSLENFDVSGLFLLTELDHGLDTRNLETQAVRRSDGHFDLHTPRLGAAKTMPPNGLWGGVDRRKLSKFILYHEPQPCFRCLWRSQFFQNGGMTDGPFTQSPSSTPAS